MTAISLLLLIFHTLVRFESNRTYSAHLSSINRWIVVETENSIIFRYWPYILNKLKLYKMHMNINFQRIRSKHALFRPHIKENFLTKLNNILEMLEIRRLIIRFFFDFFSLPYLQHCTTRLPSVSWGKVWWSRCWPRERSTSWPS